MQTKEAAKAPKGYYVPPGHYTAKMLAREARLAAQDNAKRTGGGRPFGIEWEINACPGGIALVVSYHCNRPDGNCGLYRTSVAL